MAHIILALAFSIIAQASQTASEPSQPPAEQTKVDAGFAQILADSQTAMAKAKTLAVSAVVTTRSSLGGESSPDTVLIHKIAGRRPDAVAIEAESTVGDVTRTVLRAVSDGKSLVTLYTGGPDLTSRYDGPSPAAQIASTLIIAKVLEGSGLDILIRPDMRRYVLRQTRKARLVGEEEVGGLMVEHFRVLWNDQDVDMWIGPKDQPFLRKFAHAKNVTLTDGKKMDFRREAFLTWKVDKVLPAETFALDVPKNARVVEDIYKTLHYAETAEMVGKPAPEAVFARADQGEIKLSGLRGKPVVLAFWESWSAPSREALPWIAELEGQFREQGVVVLAVEVGDTREESIAARKSLAKIPTIVLDSDDRVAIAFGVSSLPTAVLIGRDGVVKSIHPVSGEKAQEAIIGAVKTLLAR